MQKYALFFAVIVLLGAGCTKPVENEPTSIQAVIMDNGNGDVTIEVLPENEVVKLEEERENTMPAKKVEMISDNFYFDPASITVQTGQKVEITFSKNSGFHTFVIDEIGFKKTVSSGETLSFTAPEKAGEYTFYCDVGSHRALGMEGVLYVKEL